MAELPVDPRIEGFSDFELLGWGGFGAVYRARQAGLGREVAVKVLVTAGMDDRVRQRFSREQKAMGSLSQHPGIVTLYESGFTEAGLPYLVMELMEGGSLADRIAASGPLRVSEAVTVMTQVAEAVAEAHRVGVLHRDIKPENILISKYGNPKLTDFGISTLAGGTVTVTTTVSATVEHAAPEVLDGRTPTEATDVYSLASTLYALLSGHSPYRQGADDSMLGIIKRVATDSVPLIPGIPAELQHLLDGCLAKDPANRPQSADRFATALRALALDTGVTAAAPTTAATITGRAKTTGRATTGRPAAAATRAILRPEPVVSTPPPAPNRIKPLVIAAGLGAVVLVAIVLAANREPAPVIDPGITGIVVLTPPDCTGCDDLVQALTELAPDTMPITVEQLGDRVTVQIYDEGVLVAEWIGDEATVPVSQRATASNVDTFVATACETLPGNCPTTTTSSSTTTTTTEAPIRFSVPAAREQVIPGNGAGYPANGSGCTPEGDVLPDGMWFGYVRDAAHDAGGGGFLSFDLACFYNGVAASAEAQHDNESLFGGTFYVRNVNPLLFEPYVSARARVYWLDFGGDYHEVTYAQWPVADSVLGYCQFECGVWLVVDGGVVTGLWEQEPPYSD